MCVNTKNTGGTQERKDNTKVKIIRDDFSKTFDLCLKTKRQDFGRLEGRKGGSTYVTGFLYENLRLLKSCTCVHRLVLTLGPSFLTPDTYLKKPRKLLGHR